MPRLIALTLIALLTACGGDDGTPAPSSAAQAPAADAVAAAPAHPGEDTYNKFCISCHGMGAAGAPVLGDTAAWAERAAKGRAALVASTVNGLNAMPPMGMCRRCSEEDIGDAVDYMLEQAQ